MRLMSNDPRSKYCLSIKYLVSRYKDFNDARFIILKFVTLVSIIIIYYYNLARNNQLLTDNVSNSDNRAVSLLKLVRCCSLL